MKKIDVQGMADVWFSISVAACSVFRISSIAEDPGMKDTAETLKSIAENLEEMGCSEEYHGQVSLEAIKHTIMNFINKEELLENYRNNPSGVLKDLAEMLENCKDIFFEKLEAGQLSGKSDEKDLTDDFNGMIDCQQALLGH